MRLRLKIDALNLHAADALARHGHLVRLEPQESESENLSSNRPATAPLPTKAGVSIPSPGRSSSADTMCSQGKIVEIGPENKVAIPEGAVVRDMRARSSSPGLVDTHSHIAIFNRPSAGAATAMR